MDQVKHVKTIKFEDIISDITSNYSVYDGVSYRWVKESLLASAKWTPPIESENAIRLDLNENQFVDNLKWQRLVSDIDWSSIHQYPIYDDLQHALAKDVGISEDYILPTNGADQAIEIIIRSLNRDLTANLVVPTFSYYQHVLDLEDIVTQKIPYSPELTLDLDAVLQSISSTTSSVLLTSPSNPLTLEITQHELVAILEQARAFDVLVVVDEVYCCFSQQDFSNLIKEYDNLALIRSYSKYHGVASVRLGSIVSCPQNIHQFGKIRGPWDISGFASQIVTKIINTDDWLDFIPNMVTNREVVSQALRNIGASVVPSNINFITFFHHRADELLSYFRQHGIIVARLSNYPDASGLLDNALRMSVPNDIQLNKLQPLIKEFNNESD